MVGRVTLRLWMLPFILGSIIVLGGGNVEARRAGSANPASGLQDSGDTIDVSDNHGGSVGQYDGMWAAYAAAGKRVRIVGPCQSACTTLLGHIPRDRICVKPQASFGFHRARTQYGTETMWNGYPADIRAWIKSQDGLTAEFKWMTAPNTYQFFAPCRS